jgi:hypothetical protein
MSGVYTIKGLIEEAFGMPLSHSQIVIEIVPTFIDSRTGDVSLPSREIANELKRPCDRLYHVSCSKRSEQDQIKARTAAHGPKVNDLF